MRMGLGLVVMVCLAGCSSTTKPQTEGVSKPGAITHARIKAPSYAAQDAVIRAAASTLATLLLDKQKPLDLEKTKATLLKIATQATDYLTDPSSLDDKVTEVKDKLLSYTPSGLQSIVTNALDRLESVTVDPGQVIGVRNLRRLLVFMEGIQLAVLRYYRDDKDPYWPK